MENKAVFEKMLFQGSCVHYLLQKRIFVMVWNAFTQARPKMTNFAWTSEADYANHNLEMQMMPQWCGSSLRNYNTES